MRLSPGGHASSKRVRFAPGLALAHLRYASCTLSEQSLQERAQEAAIAANSGSLKTKDMAYWRAGMSRFDKLQRLMRTHPLQDWDEVAPELRARFQSDTVKSDTGYFQPKRLGSNSPNPVFVTLPARFSGIL